MNMIYLQFQWETKDVLNTFHEDSILNILMVFGKKNVWDVFFEIYH